MPIQQYKSCGKVRVRIKKWPFDDGVYYDEYIRPDRRGDPNATIYIPVEDGQYYAIEITFFNGFYMGCFTHLRCRVKHAGQNNGRFLIVNRKLTEDLNGTNRLRSDIVEKIDRKNRGRIGGVEMRDLKFVVKGLTPDSSLPPDGSRKDLNAFLVDVYRFQQSNIVLAHEEAMRRLNKNRALAQRRESAHRVPPDDFELVDKVDFSSFKKGVKHTPNLERGPPVIHGTPNQLGRKGRSSQPRTYNKRGSETRDDPLGFNYRFFSIKDIKKGNFIKLNKFDDKPDKKSDEDSHDDSKSPILKKRLAKVKFEVKEEKNIKGDKERERKKKIRIARLTKFGGSPFLVRILKRSKTPIKSEINSDRRRGRCGFSNTPHDPIIIDDDDAPIFFNSVDHPITIHEFDDYEHDGFQILSTRTSTPNNSTFMSNSRPRGLGRGRSSSPYIKSHKIDSWENSETSRFWKDYGDERDFNRDAYDDKPQSGCRRNDAASKRGRRASSDEEEEGDGDEDMEDYGISKRGGGGSENLPLQTHPNRHRPSALSHRQTSRAEYFPLVGAKSASNDDINSYIPGCHIDIDLDDINEGMD